jgi:hypothetical protein
LEIRFGEISIQQKRKNETRDNEIMDMTVDQILSVALQL